MHVKRDRQRKDSGVVFNIQHYSLHDGPGIRTTVFLKGCPLRCRWCSNPESQHPFPELAYTPAQCIDLMQCGHCIEQCSGKAISPSGNGIAIDWSRCVNCLACAEACPAQALHAFGMEMHVNEVMAAVEADEAFFARSGGGMTLSGGEPLSQFDFTLALLREAKHRRIHTAMETCGLAPWNHLAEVCRHLDMIIYDIKTIDNIKHKKHTGSGNKVILQNFMRLCREFPRLPKKVRTPLIPGFNDNEQDIDDIVDFIRGQENVSLEILPYHRMGANKYAFLGRDYQGPASVIDDARLSRIRLKALTVQPCAKTP